MTRRAALSLCLGAFGAIAAQAATLDLARPEVQAFIDEAAAEHGLERAWVE